MNDVITERSNLNRTTYIAVYFSTVNSFFSINKVIMNNLLSEAADNVFITSAAILDTLTHRMSSVASKMIIPNNNDSMCAPLTQQLVEDYDAFNQVLNDYSLDLHNCIYALNSFKIKNEKEKILKEKQEQQRKLEEQDRLRKEQEAKERSLREQEEAKAKADAEAEMAKTHAAQQQQNQFTNSANLSATPSSNQPNMTNVPGNEDMMMDLDLDNFDFDGNDMNNDVMDFNFDDYTSNDKEATTNNTNNSTKIPANTAQNSANMEFNNNMFEGEDAELGDLNLDFLQDDDNNNTGSNIDQNNNDMNNLIQNIDSNVIENNNNGGMDNDQMEQLFSQFDDIVGGNDMI